MLARFGWITQEHQLHAPNTRSHKVKILSYDKLYLNNNVITIITPGYVFVKRRADSEESRILLLLHDAPTSSLGDAPTQMVPGGLTEERQRYLYRFVRHLVRPCAQDQTCPAPEE